MSRYDFRKRSDDALIFNTEPSMTKQEHKDHCDMNVILKKYAKNGVNPFVITENAKYGDFSKVPSYTEAMELVLAADDHFNSLPAEMRARFENDPAQLLSFIQNDENFDEAVELGLVTRPIKKVQPEPKLEPEGDKIDPSKSKA